MTLTPILLAHFPSFLHLFPNRPAAFYPRIRVLDPENLCLCALDYLSPSHFRCLGQRYIGVSMIWVSSLCELCGICGLLLDFTFVFRSNLVNLENVGNEEEDIHFDDFISS